MNRPAVRAALRDPWLIVLLVVTPISVVLQFLGDRSPIETALSLTVIAVAFGSTLYTVYQRAQTRLLERQDRDEEQAHAAALAALYRRTS